MKESCKLEKTGENCELRSKKTQLFERRKSCRKWGSNPRLLRLVPETSALDHSAISTETVIGGKIFNNTKTITAMIWLQC